MCVVRGRRNRTTLSLFSVAYRDSAHRIGAPCLGWTKISCACLVLIIVVPHEHSSKSIEIARTLNGLNLEVIEDSALSLVDLSCALSG